MKAVILFLTMLLPWLPANSEEDSTTVTQTFIHQQGKTYLYVLQIKGNSHYDYMRYDKKHTMHDWGVFSIDHGKITFVSNNRKRGFNSVGGKTFFLSKKGMYKTRMDKMFSRRSVLDFSDDAQYRGEWAFNPLAGKSLEAPKKPAAPVLTTEQRKDKAGIYVKNYYLALTGTYASPFKGILEEAYTGPESYRTVVNGQYLEWNMDTTANVLFSDFETVIHESTHMYERKGSRGIRYMIEPGINIDVNKTEQFKSAEVKAIAPADAPSKIFRYNTYISDSSINSANVEGFYGLMDEFCAYHSGMRAATLAAQNAMQKGDTATASKFISQAGGTYFAYYEFNLFMAWYLHEAKTKHPEMYKELMDNTNLRVAYTLLDAEFAQDITNFKRTSDIIQKATGSDAYGFNDKTYAAYPKQLLTKEKSYLDAFRVKGVNNGNYFTFIK